MATRQTRPLPRFMMAPVRRPAARLDDRAAGDDALWFSFQNYNLLNPGPEWLRAGLQLQLFPEFDPGFWPVDLNTLLLVGGVLLITVVGGILLALLLDQPIFGQGIVRILVISPFFVMPPVARWCGRT
jgi:sorbitol/mannitol transport system permease protein